MRRLLCLLLLLLSATGAAAQTPLPERSESELLSGLRHPNPYVRIESADELGRRRAAAALLPLLGLLRDRDAEVRAHAAEALRSLGDERAVPFLARVLRDPDPTVRCRAALALGGLGDRYLVPTLTRMLDDPATIVRAAAIRALGEIRDPLSLEPVLDALAAEEEDRNDAVACAALVSAAKLGGGGGLDRALVLVRDRLDGSWLLRATAAHAGGAAGDPARIPVLMEVLREDTDPRVVQAAAAALSDLGAVGELIAALDEDIAFRRRAAVAGLARHPGAEARSALVRAARDENPGVTLEAAAALVRKGERKAFPVLIDLLESREASVWLGALEVLELCTGLPHGRDPPRWREWYREFGEEMTFDPASEVWEGTR